MKTISESEAFDKYIYFNFDDVMSFPEFIEFLEEKGIAVLKS